MTSAFPTAKKRANWLSLVKINKACFSPKENRIGEFYTDTKQNMRMLNRDKILLAHFTPRINGHGNQLSRKYLRDTLLYIFTLTLGLLIINCVLLLTLSTLETIIRYLIPITIINSYYITT